MNSELFVPVPQDTIARAIERLGAKELTNYAPRPLLGKSYAFKLYGDACKWSPWYITSEQSLAFLGVRLKPSCAENAGHNTAAVSDFIELYATEVKAQWWTASEPFAFVAVSLDGERFAGPVMFEGTEAQQRRAAKNWFLGLVRSGQSQRITVDLATGEEIPA